MDDRKEPQGAVGNAVETKPADSSSQEAGKGEGDVNNSGKPLTILGRFKKWLSIN